jgi:hypothetical protein
MRKVSFLLLSFALLASSGIAATLYVSADTGDDGNDGSSWTQAKRSIQAAVNAADNGDVILVSNGIYTATASQVVSITKSVDIRSVNGPEETIIDGGSSRQCVSAVPSDDGNPIYLSGFSIRNGAKNNGAGVYKGGPRDFYLSNCVIHANNSSGSGAGIYKGGNVSQMIVTDCIISNNQSGGYGAGVSVGNAGRLFMFDCDIVNNESTLGGGGVSGSSYTNFPGTIFELHGCRIAGNTTLSDSGGGIYSVGRAGGTCVVNNCFVEYNSATNAGGGILHRNLGGDLFISNCIIRGNEAGRNDYAGAGVKIDGPCRMTGCLITGNKATRIGIGGGLALESGTNVVEIENVTIVSNSLMYANNGGGLAIPSNVTAACTIRNTIIYNNTSVGNARSNVFVGAGSGVIFTNCCTAPLNNGTDQPITPDAGNIDLDPVFVNLTGGDYRLQSDSPCINTGANMLWMADAVDLDGRHRIDRFSRLVDMGCYEYVPQGAMFNLR